MKRYIYLLTVAALAAFSCAPEGPADDSAKEYAGNKVNVTAPEAIPAQGGTVTATVVTTLDADVPFTVSVPKAATWIKVGDITEEQREVEVGKEVNGEMIAETVTEVVRTVKFTAATANESAEMRYASVGLIDAEKGFVISRFDVTQDGVGMAEKKPFAVSTREINVEANETTASFNIETEVAWTVTSSNENFVVSPASGEGNGTVTVTFPTNEGLDAEVAELTVATEDPLARPKAHTVVITQASAVKTFVVTTENSLTVAHDAFNVLFNINSDVKWIATSSNEAFKFTDGESSSSSSVEVEGNKNLFVVFKPNFTSAPLTTTVTFTTDDPLVTEKTYSFDITQGAYQIVSQTILAEWIFVTSEKDKLNANFNEKTGNESCHAPGNGGLYVPNNGAGNGRFEYYNGEGKAVINEGVAKINRCKRVIGGSGEPCIYGTFVNDYVMYSAVSPTELPAGTKVHLFTVWRPKEAQVMKYWKAEYLDGTEWKPAAELKTATVAGAEVQYNVEVDHADGRLPHTQKNTYLDFVVELTVPATEVKFRITAVVNAAADGSGPVPTPYGGSYVLRVAGGDSASDDNFYLNVPKNHVIEVVQ